MSTPKDKAFLPALESARGIAAVLVMLSHFWWWSKGETGNALFRAASLGVDFFFVLSGFILSRTYFGENQARPWKIYLWNRLVRIYPLHLFFVAAFSCAYAFTGKSLREFNWMAEIALTTSVGSDNVLNGVSWSLSAEWISYLLFAAALGMVSARSRGLFFIITAVLAGVTCYILSGGNITSLSYKWGFLRAIFGFFVGCMSWQYAEKFGDSRAILWVAVVFQMAYVVAGSGYEHFKIWLVLSFSPLVVYLSTPSLQQCWLVWRPVLWVGTISFSLYMGHVFWGEVLEAVLPRLGLPLQEGHHALEICKSCAAFAGAALTYYLVEKPARSWGRSLSPFRAR